MHMSLLNAVKLAVSPSGCRDMVGQVGSLKHISMAQTRQDLMENERSHFGPGPGGISKTWGNMQYTKKSNTVMQGSKSKWYLSYTEMDITVCETLLTDQKT